MFTKSSLCRKVYTGKHVLILELYMQYAELKPVPCITYADAFALREQCATPILKQVSLKIHIDCK
jgi:hypothetical protein